MILMHISKEDFAFSEGIKTLRTNLQFSGSKVKNILITSVAGNDGKSHVSFALAKAFAESGKKTLYLDMDIRNSNFLERFGVSEEIKGLSQILSGQILPEEGIYATNIDNLFVVWAGPWSPSPTELFEDDMCRKLFMYIAEQEFDRVILDTSPLGAVIDAAILSRYADGIALMAASGETNRKALRRVKEQIDRTGTRFLGVILNKVPIDKKGYEYGYGYEGYGYGKKNMTLRVSQKNNGE